MSLLKSIGHALKVAAPFVGKIPVLGTVGATALGGLGGLAESGNLRGTLQGAAGGLTGGLASKFFGGGGGGNILSKIGGAVKDTYAPGGHLAMDKILGTVGAASDMIGKHKQRASASRYNNAMIDQRNKLMSQIMTPQNYGLPEHQDTTGIGY